MILAKLNGCVQLLCKVRCNTVTLLYHDTVSLLLCLRRRAVAGKHIFNFFFLALAYFFLYFFTANVPRVAPFFSFFLSFARERVHVCLPL